MFFFFLSKVLPSYWTDLTPSYWTVLEDIKHQLIIIITSWDPGPCRYLFRDNAALN